MMTAGDPALRALAGEMAQEELEHVVAIEKLIEALPQPADDWEAAQRAIR